jgi:hypothetical protein
VRRREQSWPKTVGLFLNTEDHYLNLTGASSGATNEAAKQAPCAGDQAGVPHRQALSLLKFSPCPARSTRYVFECLLGKTIGDPVPAEGSSNELPARLRILTPRGPAIFSENEHRRVYHPD